MCHETIHSVVHIAPTGAFIYILSTCPLSVWTHHWGITRETFLKSIPEGPVNVYRDIMMWTEMAVWEKCPSWKVILIFCLVCQELLQYIFVLVNDLVQRFSNFFDAENLNKHNADPFARKPFTKT